jgi:hypothetical protein
VYFLYLDDLNNPHTKKYIKQSLSQETDDIFYPPKAIWINCKAFTYQPHSNECGPRTLLAITVMLLHPEPSTTVLLEYMVPNITQISRTWVAAVILTGQPIIPTIYQSTAQSSPRSWTAHSEPFSLVEWNQSNNINMGYSYYHSISTTGEQNNPMSHYRDLPISTTSLRSITQRVPLRSTGNTLRFTNPKQTLKPKT